MTYRYLPYVRSGLAARITTADSLSGPVPVRAALPVRLTLSTGQKPFVTALVHGPGDVAGIDPSIIVRVDPLRFAVNVPPNQFASIDFDPPDFPWMFTPVGPTAPDQLRPWLVLVVVTERGDSIDPVRGQLLPRLRFSGGAAREELPDLSESWAWAHTQLIEAGGSSPEEQLRAHPAMNVSRLVCPRRLRPDTSYVAAVVPAFAAGRLAGLGLDVPDAATTAPAWELATVPATFELPMYFHWTFRTGAAGDFESLAKRLTPRPVPDDVGRQRMFIGAASPGLPAPPATAEVVVLEGALRAPEAGAGTPLPSGLEPWRDALRDLLNLPADVAAAGAGGAGTSASAAEAVAPPGYGGGPIRAERVTPATAWFEELNTDPRHRANAGLGAEIVRVNQEALMHDAWTQVGDVLAANERLDRARLIEEIATRVHSRHIATLGPAAAVHVAAPIYGRVVDARHGTLARRVRASHLPDAVGSAAFRRVAAPRSVTLSRARRARGESSPATSAAAASAAFGRLATGDLRFDILTTPDGLLHSRLLAELPADVGGFVEFGTQIGMRAAVSGALLAKTITGAQLVRRVPPPGRLTLRPDLSTGGVVLDRHVRTATELGAPVVTTVLAAVVEATRTTPTLAGVAVTRPTQLGDVGVSVASLVRDASGALGAVGGRPVRIDGVPIDGAPHGGARTAASAASPALRREHRRALAARAAQPKRKAGGVRIRPEEAAAFLGAGVGRVFEPAVTVPEVVVRYREAFESHQVATAPKVVSVVPAPVAFDIDAVRTLVVSATAPGHVITRRAELGVRVGAAALLDVTGGIIRPRAPLDPVMAAPVIDDPMYEFLARSDQERLLPGVGRIPDDTVTMLETNPRFVEAFLVGANHELNRELLWRRYPTDRRGTPIRRFWDRLDGTPDVAEVHTFAASSRLGEHGPDAAGGSLVLLVKGRLLRRFPNAVVHAQRARADRSLDDSPSAIRTPIFWGRLGDDITFVGFDLTVEQVSPAPGWYFLISEQPSEPRFGFDERSGSPGAPANWAEVDWDHLGVPPGGHLRLQGSPFDGRIKPVAGAPSPPTVRATFGRNAADMAAVTFQRPFRAAIHSSRVIAGAQGPTAAFRPVLTQSSLLRPILLEG